MKKLITATLFALVLLTSTTQAADEGIKVHGHWTFKIYNPDGSFDRKVEFENSLQTSGATILINTLTRANQISKWSVGLFSNGGSGFINPCFNSVNNISEECIADELGEPGDFPTISIANVGDTKFVLSGYVTASKDPNLNISIGIDSAVTYIGGVPFTQKTLASPVTLQDGEVVHFTVEISFS